MRIATKTSPEHNWNVHVAQAKIKPDQFDKIISEYIPGVISMCSIAEQYGCSRQAIGNIINGERMTHEART